MSLVLVRSAPVASQELPTGGQVASKEAKDDTPPSEAVIPPAAGGAFPVTVEPAMIVLGTDHEARVTVEVNPDSGPVNIFSVLGDVSPLEETETGTYSARYTPPEQFLPQVDIIGAVALVDGELVWGFAAIPLIGQGEAEIRTNRFAKAVIHIQDKLFGPVKADREGKARIRVQVPPGTFIGQDGEGQEVDLRVPYTPRVAIFAVVSEFQLGEPGSIPLLGVVVAPDGTQCGDDVEVVFAATSGEVVDIRAAGDGAFTANYAPPASGAGSVELSVQVPDDPHPPAEFEILLKAKPPPVIEEDPQPPPPPEPPPHVPWLNTAAKVGLGWNFGQLWSFDLSADVGIKLPVLDGRLGLGFELGFAVTSGDASQTIGVDQSSQLSSTTWIVPFVGSAWFRQPLSNRWALVFTAQGGGVLVDNRIERWTGGAAGRGEDHERSYHPGVGGAVAVEFALGIGSVLVETRYLWIGGDFETVDGVLSPLFFTAGYRFFFL